MNWKNSGRKLRFQKLVDIMHKIIIFDFGSQYAHLIARRFRSLGYYSEIKQPNCDINEIKNVKGIVLSGGPSSVYEKNAPKFNSSILKLQIPILGLCYGHHLLLKEYGGKVEKAKIGEFGYTVLNKVEDSMLFKNVKFPTQVWMSHSDEVITLPEGFKIIGESKDCKIAATENLLLNRFTLQFHAEVKDTIYGDNFFDNFAKICKMRKNWDSLKVLSSIKKKIKLDVKNKKVILFLSGGVDSSVAFALLCKTLGKNKVKGLYINNGFMRKNETEKIYERYKKAGLDNFIIEDAENIFLNAIGNTVDPQKKRMIIGETFLKVKENVLKNINLNEEDWLLAQGTLYPDIIESGGTKHSDVIKTHHNRVEGIKQLLDKGLVIEPLKDLYKDEVRQLGKKIGLSDEIVYRHPFPGPGLSINCLCSNGFIENKSEYDLIIKKINNPGINKSLDKNIIKLEILPVKSVGVQGDFRTYSYPAVINNYKILSFSDWDKLEEYSSYLTNKIKEINRVIIQLFKKKECSLIEAYCTKKRLDMIREVDFIVLNTLQKYGWYNKIFQHLTINLPFSSNNNNCSIVLRPVNSDDVMTARFAHLDITLLNDIIYQIKKMDFVDSLFYDITNKPPATFGWE